MEKTQWSSHDWADGDADFWTERVDAFLNIWQSVVSLPPGRISTPIAALNEGSRRLQYVRISNDATLTTLLGSTSKRFDDLQPRSFRDPGKESEMPLQSVLERILSEYHPVDGVWSLAQLHKMYKRLACVPFSDQAVSRPSQRPDKIEFKPLTFDQQNARDDNDEMPLAIALEHVLFQPCHYFVHHILTYQPEACVLFGTTENSTEECAATIDAFLKSSEYRAWEVSTACALAVRRQTSFLQRVNEGAAKETSPGTIVAYAAPIVVRGTASLAGKGVLQENQRRQENERTLIAESGEDSIVIAKPDLGGQWTFDTWDDTLERAMGSVDLAYGHMFTEACRAVQRLLDLTARSERAERLERVARELAAWCDQVAASQRTALSLSATISPPLRGLQRFGYMFEDFFVPEGNVIVDRHYLRVYSPPSGRGDGDADGFLRIPTAHRPQELAAPEDAVVYCLLTLSTQLRTKCTVEQGDFQLTSFDTSTPADRQKKVLAALREVAVTDDLMNEPSTLRLAYMLQDFLSERTESPHLSANILLRLKEYLYDSRKPIPARAELLVWHLWAVGAKTVHDDQGTVILDGKHRLVLGRYAYASNWQLLSAVDALLAAHRATVDARTSTDGTFSLVTSKPEGWLDSGGRELLASLKGGADKKGGHLGDFASALRVLFDWIDNGKCGEDKDGFSIEGPDGSRILFSGIFLTFYPRVTRAAEDVPG